MKVFKNKNASSLTQCISKYQLSLQVNLHDSDNFCHLAHKITMVVTYTINSIFSVLNNKCRICVRLLNNDVSHYGLNDETLIKIKLQQD